MASVSHINNTTVLEAVSLDCIEHGCIVGMGVDSYVVVWLRQKGMVFSNSPLIAPSLAILWIVP